MKSIHFKNITSQKMYDNYVSRIKSATIALNKADREEVLLELNSHIFEATNTINDSSEEDVLRTVLNKLGDPKEVLKPLIADKKLAEATKTPNPTHIFNALIFNISNGILYLIFSILYLSIFIFLYAIILKILNPKEVGLFYVNGSLETLGTYKGLPTDHIEELLGNWFIPVMLLCAAVLFVIITLLLRLKKKIKS